MKKRILFIAVGLLGLHPSLFAAEPISVEDVLVQAYRQNPEIAAAQARADAEQATVRSRYWLTNPRVGLMREVNMDDMQRELGPMNSWTISQELMFPSKYFTMGSAQKSRARAADQEALDKKLEVRQKVLTAYYNLYSATRIHLLLLAQKETLREIARVAEARRATGAVPQQDEMKAHVEQTRLENELILHDQDLVEARSQLNALLNRDASEEISILKDETKAPRLTKPIQDPTKLAVAGSKTIAASQQMLEEAQSERLLAVQGYLPDFMLSYRKPFTNALNGAYSASIEMTIPLWFFMKQSSEVSAASARTIQAEKTLEMTVRNAQAEARSVSTKVETYEKLLTIYETALIPQATSTLNSSRTAYSAGRAGFLDLLDSERSLYSVRIDYYRTLAKYVESLTQLERVTGSSLSTLPF